MLVLTRKINESIIIDGNIEVKLLVIEDGKIRLGIEAPRSVEILRKELYDTVKEENIKSKGANKKLKDLDNKLRVKKCCKI